MFTVLVILIVLFIILAATVVFLLNEMSKKFRIMKNFMDGCKNQVVSFRNHGRYNDMVHLCLTWDRPFEVLVGFQLKLDRGLYGYDYFGYAQSRPRADGRHEIVVETYFGYGACTFEFLLNQPYGELNRPTTMVCPPKGRTPTAVYPPHWWQKYLPI